MAGVLWTQPELEIASEKYENTPKSELLRLLPGRSWHAIALRARKIGVRRVWNDRIKADLPVLLNDTPIAYYWAGFIAADGSVDNKIWRLRITLASSDSKHLESFAQFIGSKCNHYTTKSVVSVQDKYWVPKLCQKFDLRERKTYYPPESLALYGDAFVSFLIGFIDGDGNIQHQSGRSDCFLRIKVHSNWLAILELMVTRLYSLIGIVGPLPRLNSAGYAEWTNANHKVIRFLKIKSTSLRLPVLVRKWNKVNENVLSRYEIIAINLEKVKTMLTDGLKQIEIARRLRLSKACICQMVKKIKRA